MTDKGTESIPLSAKERALLKQIAERDGISEDEAASNLVKSALARRAKKRSAAPARVVPIRRK